MRDGQFTGGCKDSCHLRNRDQAWGAVRAWLRKGLQIRNERVRMLTSMEKQKVTHDPEVIATNCRVEVWQGLRPAVKHLRANQANLPELLAQEIIPTSEHRLFSGIPPAQSPAQCQILPQGIRQTAVKADMV